MFQECLVAFKYPSCGRSRSSAAMSFALWVAIAAAPSPVHGSVEAGTQGVAQPATAAGPVRISFREVSEHLLEPYKIVWPKIAILRRDQGMVVVDAVISKEGQIESARVVSGPETLEGAVLQAVRESRYRPFVVNGQSVEVETMVRIGFSRED